MDVSSLGLSESSPYKFKRGEKDNIISQALDCLLNDDAIGLEQIFKPYKEIDPWVFVEVWYLFNPSQRSTMKKLLSGE